MHRPAPTISAGGRRAPGAGSLSLMPNTLFPVNEHKPDPFPIASMSITETGHSASQLGGMSINNSATSALFRGTPFPPQGDDNFIATAEPRRTEAGRRGGGRKRSAPSRQGASASFVQDYSNQALGNASLPPSSPAGGSMFPQNPPVLSNGNGSGQTASTQSAVFPAQPTQSASRQQHSPQRLRPIQPAVARPTPAPTPVSIPTPVPAPPTIPASLPAPPQAAVSFSTGAASLGSSSGSGLTYDSFWSSHSLSTQSYRTLLTSSASSLPSSGPRPVNDGTLNSGAQLSAAAPDNSPGTAPEQNWTNTNGTFWSS